jgi:hypothetical protein
MKVDMPGNNIQIPEFLTNSWQSQMCFRSYAISGDQAPMEIEWEGLIHMLHSQETGKTRGKSRSFLYYSHLSCISHRSDVCWERYAMKFCVTEVFCLRREMINLSFLHSFTYVIKVPAWGEFIWIKIQKNIWIYLNKNTKNILIYLNKNTKICEFIWIKIQKYTNLFEKKIQKYMNLFE